MSAAFGSAGDRPFTAYTCSPFHSRACGRAEPSPRLPARNLQAAGAGRLGSEGLSFESAG